MSLLILNDIHPSLKHDGQGRSRKSAILEPGARGEIENRILSLLRRSPQVSAEAIARDLKLPEEPVRRAINDLRDRNLVRSHTDAFGGTRLEAVNSSVTVASYTFLGS
ncbi:winged helix-turn-helix transcriptional regulator [Methylobacterium radiodurans]|uniref:Winged helix-turn-helix transcriptional regulator n=1 Tax=Methylobacterium radiodurans TaxID=2202828 RepID=A0A2U8VQ91_9HYPH|nr:winged helix-turn-helix transcriptional regulator [Methylobacterium radiodurans]AWN35680.1 hypothetical protein DK427_07935 [Methylobacterium radiodurans]